MLTGLAWAVCQHQDQTEVCCSTSQPLPWRLATPQQPACEGRKQEAGCSAFLSASPVVLGCWGWRGGGQERRERTQRGLTAPNKAFLTHRACGRHLSGQRPTRQSPFYCSLLWHVLFPGREPSLCLQILADDLCTWTGPRTLLDLWPDRWGCGEFLPSSTWHLFMLL